MKDGWKELVVEGVKKWSTLLWRWKNTSIFI